MEELIIINTGKKISPITADIFSAAFNLGLKARVFSSKAGSEKIKNFCELVYILPDIEKTNFFSLKKFWWATKIFFILILNRTSQNKKKIIIIGQKGRATIALIGKMTGSEVFWLEEMSASREKMSAWKNKLVKAFSRLVKIMAIGELSAEKNMAMGIPQDKIIIIPAGIDEKLFDSQKNIFARLAEEGLPQKWNKFFTIGTWVDFSQKNHLENLFKSAQECLSIANDLQIIVMGEGGDKKNFLWLTRKLGLENLVWFVGAETKEKKWINNLDLFVSVADEGGEEDLYFALRALAQGVPVIAPMQAGFDGIIKQNENGALLDVKHSEMLARQIIKIRQDKSLATAIGEEARKSFLKNFTAEMSAKKLLEELYK